jgi:hypothetical protein
MGFLYGDDGFNVRMMRLIGLGYYLPNLRGELDSVHFIDMPHRQRLEMPYKKNRLFVISGVSNVGNSIWTYQ